MSRPCASPARWSSCLLVVGLLGLTRIGAVCADQPSLAEQPAPAATSADSPPSAPAPNATSSAAPTPATPAAPTGPSPTTAGGVTTPAQLSLKDLTEQGIRQFQSGQFDAAVESFSAAHVLNPNPMFLFNIAQAHRKAGRPREALTHYQLFLRKAPDSPLRPETEAYVALVQTQLAAGANPPPPTNPAQDLQRPAGYGSSDQNPSPPRTVPIYKRGGFYVLLLGGAATVALAVGLPLYFATRPPATTLGIVDPVF